MAQDQEQRQEQNSVNILGGLNTDSSLVNQPQGTTRFVFTGVDETKEGDLGFISNEESNQACYQLPPNCIPIGQVYIGDETNLLFLVNTLGDSILATIDKECNLTIVLSDANQTEKFGFKVDNQIDATFRLRRGCERTVYWVDPKPRMFVLDKPEEFQDSVTGDWDIAKFNLFKTYKSIPVVNDLEVIDGGGQLAPGSYNFSIRYLDQDFNPTEFITSTETVMIYNSSVNAPYRDIRGATKETNGSYLGFSNSNKSIKITLDPNSLDTTFPFYQIAITEANTGNGLISDTKYTQEISTKDSVFYYTGTNFETQGTQEEVTAYNQIIEKAQNIEQIENRLILGDVEGKQVNFCKLQKYASQINSDLVTKEVFLNSIPIDDANAKDPVAHFNGMGYMPGEVYSFGIVYIFEDNSLSPVFHIPGKGPSVPSNFVYSPGPNVYGMPKENNFSEDNKYIDNNTCGTDLFWGYDYQGLPLTDEVVRHHRFPLRTDYGLRFIEPVSTTNLTTPLKSISISVQGNVTVPTVCPSPGEQYYDAACVNTFVDPFSFEIFYDDGTTTQSFVELVELDDFAAVAQTPPVAATENVSLFYNTPPITSNALNFLNIQETVAGVTANVPFIISPPSPTGMNVYTATSATTGLVYKITVNESAFATNEKQYVTDLFGIKFSNIVKPSITDTNGQDIIGYYIVRNERTEEERTILDSTVIVPTLKNKNFVSQGFIYPELDATDERKATIQKDIFGLIIPEHKFNNREYTNFTSIIQQGEFQVDNRIRSLAKINDVSDGTSYDSGRHKGAERDSDGWSLHIKTRDNHTSFIRWNHSLVINYNTDVKELFYLNALGDKIIKDSTGTSQNVFNLAADNKIAILSLDNELTISPYRLPYGYIYRQNINPYSNFRLDPYYKESKNPHYFTSVLPQTCEIFNGDSYINPIRYTNSIFYENRVRKRAGQTNAWNYVGAALLFLAAVAILFIPGVGIAGSIALGTLAASLVGVATALVLSGIEQNAWAKAYGRLYNEGLRDTISDHYMLHDKDIVSGHERGFWKNPEDDELQWFGECANLWFESSVNIGLRHGSSDNTPDFLNAPGAAEPGSTLVEWQWEYFDIWSVGSGTKDVLPTTTLDGHMVNKLTYFDIERKSSKAYIGIPAAEMYLLNPDYTRRNKQKAFFHLGLEYDCCTDCVESFPHRFHWSEQAFQEELTDNFRMFLPNNYKDLEGETGKITDIFRVQNTLYVHTEEALWQCPQTFQERVTSDVISFIGTGEYFSIPPRKIVDDNNSSAGNKHKWARLKTKYGVLFPSYKEKKWYLFDGKQLNPISDRGNYSWFLNNMNFKMLDQYYGSNFKEYPFNNNPSNHIGIGYISTYDTAKERLIITKKDFEITDLTQSDYELCTDGEDITIFNDISQIISDRADDGWTYVGIEDCKMKFIRYEEVETVVTHPANTWIPPVVTTETLPSECENVLSITLPCTVDLPETFPVVSASMQITDCRGVVHSIAQTFYVTPEANTFNVTLYIISCVELGVGNSNLSISYSPAISVDPVIINYGSGDCSEVSVSTYTPGYWTTEPIEETILVFSDVVEYEDGEPFSLSSENVINHSWTMSYSLKRQEWRSWHPYLPDFYLQVQNRFYSWKNGLTHLYKHNIEGSYQTFYGTLYPFIVEFVDNPNPLLNKVWNNVLFQSEAKRFDSLEKEYFDVRDVTFNKALLYNTHQTTGMIDLVPKANTSANYLMDQTKNSLTGSVPLDRNERDWTFNAFRDLRDNYNVPMFIKDPTQLQSNYYIDKIVNPASINLNKDWTQLESFRDKFLVVRLIFDTFADKKLIFNFSALDKNISER